MTLFLFAYTSLPYSLNSLYLIEHAVSTVTLLMHSKDTGHVRPIVTGSAFERFPSCLTSCFALIVSPEPQFGPETRPSIVPDVPDFPLWIILLGLPRGILQWTANDMQSDGAAMRVTTPPGTSTPSTGGGQDFGSDKVDF